jgi:hypothetical protein
MIKIQIHESNHCTPEAANIEKDAKQETGGARPDIDLPMALATHSMHDGKCLEAQNWRARGFATPRWGMAGVAATMLKRR